MKEWRSGQKKTGLILTLGLFLFLGTSPVGAAEETSGEFLERCLGKVENIEQTDTEAGIEAGALIVATTLFLPERLASLGNDDDVWLFVATSGVLVVNAILSMMFMDGLGNALGLGLKPCSRSSFLAKAMVLFMAALEQITGDEQCSRVLRSGRSGLVSPRHSPIKNVEGRPCSEAGTCLMASHPKQNGRAT